MLVKWEGAWMIGPIDHVAGKELVDNCPHRSGRGGYGHPMYSAAKTTVIPNVVPAGKRGGGSKSMISSLKYCNTAIVGWGQRFRSNTPRRILKVHIYDVRVPGEVDIKEGAFSDTRMDDWECNQPKWYSHFWPFLYKKQSGSGENFKVPQRKRSAESSKAATKNTVKNQWRPLKQVQRAGRTA